MDGFWPTLGVLRFSLELPKATPSNNEIRGLHFIKYRALRQAWCLDVFMALKGRRPKVPLQKAFVRITRTCPGDGLDWDNALGGLKPLFDCLVMPSRRNPSGLGLIVDDSIAHIPYQPLMRQVSGPNAGTLIEIFDLNPETLQ